MTISTDYTKEETKFFNENQLVLAAFCPCDKNWEKDSFTAHPLLASVALRVVFAIVAFIIFPIIIALLAKKCTIDGHNYSGFKIAQVFAYKDLFTPIAMRNGLPNLGASCYINTCIQLLASLDPLAECLSNGTETSTLKEPLFALVDALKNPETDSSVTKKLVKDFRSELMKSDWNKGNRGGIFGTHDMLELLGFLANEFGVEISNVINGFNNPEYSRQNLEISHLPTPTLSHFMITIDQPNKLFIPPSEVKFGEDTFKLSAVVRIPGSNHYVFFEPLPNGRFGVNYDDSFRICGTNMSEARALFYTKIK